MGNRLITLCPTDFYDDGAFDETYEVDEANAIGSGKFSTVHLCWKRHTPDVRYALKVLETGVDDFSAITRIKEEIEIMQILGNHPGIISLVDVDESVPNTIRIVMDLCEGGELYDAIQERKFFAEPDAKATIRNLLEAVAYIHSKGIMHRDLKPENILLAVKDKFTDVKISDFGLAKISRDYPRRLPRSHSICGSDFYLAPEIIKQEEYGREIDIWAVGVITYVLLSGSLPFFHQVLHKLYRQIVERDVSFPEEAWKNVSKGALDFILRLLQVRAGDRLSADQSLSHPWLQGQSSGGSSFGGSFQEIANFGRSNSNNTQTSNPGARQPSSASDLNKVLSKCTSNAHPLKHARKVDNAAPAATTSTSMAPLLPAMMPTAFSAMPLGSMGGSMALQPAGLSGGRVVNPMQSTYGLSVVQSRAAQPMRLR